MTTKFDETVKYVSSDEGLLDAIGKRWSPRSFADKPISAEQLKTIFTAASWAASSYNEQPWRIIIGIKGTPVWEKIFNALVPPNQVWTKTAPVLFATVAKKTFAKNGKPNRHAMHDVGAASATLALQAASMNLHAHGMAGFDTETLRAEFKIPDDFEPVACWALGYLGDPESLPEQLRNLELSKRERKDLPEFLFGEWGKPAKF